MPRFLHLYAIPPSLLFLVPLLSIVLIIAFRLRIVSLPLCSFIPVFTIALFSLLVGGFGLAVLREQSGNAMESIEAVFLTLLRLELAICLIYLISASVKPETIPRRQICIYNAILALVIVCATLVSFISPFIQPKIPPLLPPFLYLLFATLSLPLLTYICLVALSHPVALRPPTPQPLQISPAPPSALLFSPDTPPPSPSSFKRFSFDSTGDPGVLQIPEPMHSHPSITRQKHANDTILPIHVRILERLTRDRTDTTRAPRSIDAQGYHRAVSLFLLVAQISALLSFAFDICVVVIVQSFSDNQGRTGTASEILNEINLDVWKASIVFRSLKCIFTVFWVGCIMFAWLDHPHLRSPVDYSSTPMSWTPEAPQEHRLRPRPPNISSSFCSPNLKRSTTISRIASRARSPRVESSTAHRNPSPSPLPQRAYSNILDGIRSSFHSHRSSMPNRPQSTLTSQPRSDPQRRRRRFPSLHITVPSIPRRPHSSGYLYPPQAQSPPRLPPLDICNLIDPFAPPSPGAVCSYDPRRQSAMNVSEEGVAGTRLGARGSQTLPPKRPPPRSRSRRGGASVSGGAIVQEAMLAEKLLERLDSECSS
ncbi:uncharacterized protein BT62DRAFT_130923 [Guyanagaster necrorhizus]|uniref:Uncharacterized protein n=1 Tax=Guyanagaster necrorhizus TaxID=856835 RepID=A0A9P7VSH9_9AGAR|nr:uncharacterized protein BT62DRAFT_130923 [Guyanagaster necrorhizus MCA 3950]KAG7446641.1 hypothetical protein BT62DRAFT_130923 [Guyanagaster necrorhizus MCA 3950]